LKILNVNTNIKEEREMMRKKIIANAKLDPLHSQAPPRG
jgi:hypothetical protein